MINFQNNIYNQETKERFLDSIDLNQYPRRWWERVFEKSYMFEVRNNKDLYSFTTPEILEFYKFLDIRSLTPLIVYNANLVKYGQWALNENMITDGQNHFYEMDNEVLFTCVNQAKLNKSILSYDEFFEIVRDKIVNEQDKFVFLCIFEGIKGRYYQEIVDLKLSDIDKEKSTVKLSSGRTIAVSKEFIDYAERADNEHDYISLLGEYGVGNKIIKLIPSSTIYKEKQNSNGRVVNRTVYNTIVRNIESINDLNSTITSKSISDSGMIYYLNRRADEKGTTVAELLKNPETCQDIIDKYNFNIRTRVRWLMQYENFLR